MPERDHLDHAGSEPDEGSEAFDGGLQQLIAGDGYRLDDDLDVSLARQAPGPTLDDDLPPELLELEKIPRRLWRPTLAPMRPHERWYVARRISDERLRELAYEVVADLQAADSDGRQALQAERRRARETAAPLPTPEVARRSGARAVQINVRLTPDDHARLRDAAATTGMKPTTLARALVLNGVGKILRDRDAAGGGTGPQRSAG